MKTLHPSTQELLQWFDSSHLPDLLARVVAPLREIAVASAQAYEGPELTAGLRKLLEAKDCLVRAAIAEDRRQKAATNPLASAPEKG